LGSGKSTDLGQEEERGSEDWVGPEHHFSLYTGLTKVSGKKKKFRVTVVSSGKRKKRNPHPSGKK